MRFDNRGMRFTVCGLLVLLLSIFMTGCEEEFDPTVPASVLTELEAFGFNGTLPVPDNTEYDSYTKYTREGDEYFLIIWTEADSSKFNSYKTKWGSHVRSINSSVARAAYTRTAFFELKNTIGTGIEGEVHYTSDGGTTYDNKTVSANSIVLLIYKE